MEHALLAYYLFPLSYATCFVCLFFYTIVSFYLLLFGFFFCSLNLPIIRTFLHPISLMRVRTGKAHPVSTLTKMEAGPTVKVRGVYRLCFKI